MTRFTNTVKIEDYTEEVINAIDKEVIAWLYEAGGVIASSAARNSRVDTGQLKGSWTYIVDESNSSVTIGSPLENAIWEEFGTGEYAVNGNGRKTPWRYQDAKGQWHTTRGKTPNHTLERAYNSSKKKITNRLKTRVKNVR